MPDETPFLRLLQSHKAIEHFDYGKAVAWAIEMVRQGSESDNLLMLASFSPPFDGIDIAPYVSAVLGDFGLKELPHEPAILANAYYHMLELLSGNAVRRNLHHLAQLCSQHGYPDSLMNFYLLYFAWMDLDYDGISFHREDVDARNIEDVLKREATEWIRDYEKARP